MAKLEERIKKVFVEKPIVAAFATVTSKGKPWVRYVSPIITDDFKIKFATFLKSRKVAHLKHNSEVHLTMGMLDMEKPRDYIQVEGTAKVSVAKAEREALWCTEMEQFFTGSDDPNYAIIIIEPYRIEVMGPESTEPKIWES